ncbi:MAG: sugar phosphate isomerase/epimerase [Lachnospiraceae bacterium]|nr:sugar phosphate isomerase/epimerase [Lachnospiraceae bacterium]
MGKYLIVSKVERLEEHLELAKQYGVAFELNDFFNPAVLEDETRQKQIIEKYLQAGLPEGSTMHGAFLDVVVFSQDPRVRAVAEYRMRQSMEIAVSLGVKGVVFHTNVNSMLSSREYDSNAIEKTAAYLKKLLTDYPAVDIYLENMFDATPDILAEISERLRGFPNYGVCFDYAHATIYGFPIATWVKQLAPYVHHIHINDNDLKRDLHLALGKGKIDWKQFFEYQDTYFRDCSVLIETTKPEDQRISLEYLKTGGIYGE